jgi:hypothetical protein
LQQAVLTQNRAASPWAGMNAAVGVCPRRMPSCAPLRSCLKLTIGRAASGMLHTCRYVTASKSARGGRTGRQTKCAQAF